MKFCTILFFSFFSSSLLAMPAVGDMAVYLIDIPGSGTFYSKVELIGYNQSNDTFTQKNTGYTDAGIFSVSTSNVASKNFLTRDQLLQKIFDCQTNGGSLEVIKVASEEIKTCSTYTQNNGIENFGVVPFGTVRLISRSVNVELIEYKIGQ